MAFDQSTRNRLQKFVSSARSILSAEFTRQLQATYGLDPKNGTVADISALTHLDNRQRQTAHVLREILAHYLATTPGKGENDRTKQVLTRIVREQAFTVLNRLAALRMAEARGFLLESISKDYNSKGFQLYRQLAGTSHGETGNAYKNYLFSLFDEFSLDLAALFDRYSSEGLLFPRESALLALLSEINHQEIEQLWAEDETIGWIYQYFNSIEERKKMRAESQAPRNSRELAVRNQFFTPRYVVEFLTDNTLGRIWYEMTQGETALIDSCRYLVRRPTEIFLKAGEQSPETENQEDEVLSQEELLKQPVYIPHRPLKDPRTIRMLDPACGSMHFGLYAFDLFERIYLEAWHLEKELGPDAFEREGKQQALQSTYTNIEDFKTQIPKLIIEHNIHGVDIDPRATQIAGLSLWQRAQRAWHQQGIKPQQRPVIVKSNIVCAEPMPGDKALLQEFTSQLNPLVLGQLLEVIFDKMQLAGEAGTLLKIEEEIKTAIKQASEQWQKQSGSNRIQDIFPEELEAFTSQKDSGFDLRGVDDETFWDSAEYLILEALSDYADQAESNADQKRLFAEDAAKGFAFIDLCRKRFDVVLMNPPFGEFSEKFRNIAKSRYSSGAHDILTAFVEEGMKLIHLEGILGAITSRTSFFAPTTKVWRERVIQNNLVDTWVDLGQGVLDDAMVETAAYTLRKTNSSRHSIFIDCSRSDLHSVINSLTEIEHTEDNVYIKNQDDFSIIEGSPFAYWTSEGLLKSLKLMEPLCSHGINVKVGLQTGDDFRFIRCWWEVEHSSKCWMAHAKGGENQPYLSDIHLVVNWDKGGSEICSQPSVRLNAYSKINPSNGLDEGLTFPYRTHRFSPSVLPRNTITGVAGMGIYTVSKSLYEVIGLLNSSIFNKLIDMRLGLKEINALYQAGTINPIAYPDIGTEESKYIEEGAIEIIKNNLVLFSEVESSKLFSIRPRGSAKSFSDIANNKNNEWSKNKKRIIQAQKEIDLRVAKLYGLSCDESETIISEGLELLSKCYPETLTTQQMEWNKAISYIVGDLFGRWHYLQGNKNLGLKELWEGSYLECNYIDSESSYPIAFDAKQLASQINAKLFSSGFDADRGDIFKSLVQPSGFFAVHLAMYSKSRRYAPIYWPLQTPSGSYTLWVYYHRLNEQSLYTYVNDFVEPKLSQVEQDLNSLRSKSTPSSQEEIELAKLTDLQVELKDFRDELLRLVKFWKPNLNDGVQITAAPLWKLFQHKAWQKKLKVTWEKLEKGDYDWAHLACSIWPERVLRKCHKDRSLAIAHDVESHFWHEVEVPIKRGKKPTGKTKLEWQSKNLSDNELSELITQLKETMT